MKLNGWGRLGIIASVIWVAAGPTYFHLSQEDDAGRVARDRYHLCIQQTWAAKGGVERCNKSLRQDLAFARWSSWAKPAFIPLVWAWFVGCGLFFLMRRVRRRSQERSEHDPQKMVHKVTTKGESIFSAPWRVETISGGLKVVDATGLSLAYVYFSENPNDAAKVLTLEEARRIAANIAKLPALLGAAVSEEDFPEGGG
jgi:hypothetical protein